MNYHEAYLRRNTKYVCDIQTEAKLTDEDIGDRPLLISKPPIIEAMTRSSAEVVIGELRLTRRDSRWRDRWGFRGVADIVLAMCDHDNKPFVPTWDEHDLLESCARAIGVICDYAIKCVDDYIEERDRKSRVFSPPKRQHFDWSTGDDSDCYVEPDSRGEYVYLMRHDKGLTKIGFSRNPTQRESTLQAEDPRLHLYAYAEIPKAFESRLHAIFASRRVRGEWFDLDDHHVDWIVSICGMQTTNNQERG